VPDLIQTNVASATATANKELTELQKRICDTLLEDRHQTAKDVAEKLGCDTSTVHKTLNKQHVKEYILQQVNAALLMCAPQALACQHSLLQSKSDYIRHQAASDLLNRNGVGEVNVVIGQAVQVKIDLS